MTDNNNVDNNVDNHCHGHKKNDDNKMILINTNTSLQYSNICTYVYTHAGWRSDEMGVSDFFSKLKILKCETNSTLGSYASCSFHKNTTC